MEKRKDYLICLDSDGCVFDTMELKHRECFCPALIKDWNLQGIARYARETMEFVNLYSKFRGANPYLELVRTFKLLKVRPEVIKRGVEIPDLTALEEWIAQAQSLTDGDLENYIKSHEKNDILDRSLAYSLDGEQRIAEMTINISPFPNAREVLQDMRRFADILIVSTAPMAQLSAEWKDKGMDEYIDGIAGQEAGSKAECIGKALALGYDPEKVIMIGDAPGDHLASHVNNVLFYPIIPEKEEDSWKILRERVSRQLQKGEYTYTVQQSYLKDFYERLPEKPSWAMTEDVCL